MDERERYEQWRTPHDPWEQSSLSMWDSRKDLIRQFMKFKAYVGAELPKSGVEMFDLLCEFDAIVNRYDIERDKMFKDHMATCNRPMLILSTAIPNQAVATQEASGSVVEKTL